MTGDVKFEGMHLTANQVMTKKVIQITFCSKN